MSEPDQNKVMTTQEAIRHFVKDGDPLVIGNCTVGTCYNQVTEIVKASPQFTIVPSFRVDAVIEEPRGAHPAELSGYYSLAILFWAMMDLANRSEEGFRAWMKEWVYDLPTRAAYLEHYISRFGKGPLDRIQARPYYSAPVNYGSAFTSVWDDGGNRLHLHLRPTALHSPGDHDGTGSQEILRIRGRPEKGKSG